MLSMDHWTKGPQDRNMVHTGLTRPWRYLQENKDQEPALSWKDNRNYQSDWDDKDNEWEQKKA